MSSTKIYVVGLVVVALGLMSSVSANAQGGRPDWHAASAPRVGSAVIDRWLQMQNTLNVSQADEILSPDFVPHMPAFLGITDRASYLAKFAAPGALYGHVVLQDLFGRDDMLVGRFTVHAVWPPNLPYANTFIVFFRMADGLIAEEWWELDFLGLLEQVGQLPATRDVYSWTAPSLATGVQGVPLVNSRLAGLAVEAINRSDFALQTSLPARDYKNHDVVAPFASDRAGYQFYLQNVLLAAFPDLRIMIDETVASGDRVALRCTFTGTHQGPFGQLPPTGKPVRWTSMVIYRFASGRIADAWWAYDALALMTQLMTP